jgi:hypothetical protein
MPPSPSRSSRIAPRWSPGYWDGSCRVTFRCCHPSAAGSRQSSQKTENTLDSSSMNASPCIFWALAIGIDGKQIAAHWTASHGWCRPFWSEFGPIALLTEHPSSTASPDYRNAARSRGSACIHCDRNLRGPFRPYLSGARLRRGLPTCREPENRRSRQRDI